MNPWFSFKDVFTKDTSYNILVTVSDTISKCSKVDEISIGLFVKPEIIPLEDTAICPGLVVLGSPTNNTSYTYNWARDGAVFDSVGNTTSISFTNFSSKNDTLSVDLEVVSVSNCSVYDSLNVIVFPTPSVEILSDSFLKYCDTSSFTDEIFVNGFKGSKFQWNIAGGEIVSSSQQKDSITVNWFPKSVKTLKVEEVSLEGCIGSDVSFSFDYDYSYPKLNNLTRATHNEYTDNIIDWNPVNWISKDSFLLYGRRVYPDTTTWLLKSQLKASDSLISDTVGLVQKAAYQYYVAGYNKCNDRVTSIIHTMIYLAGNVNESSNSIDLNWTPYKGWRGNESGYEIYRKLNDESDYQFYDYLDSGVYFMNYNEVDIAFNHCFQIKALENVDKSTMAFESWSNFVCFNFDHDLIIPNAITPNNDNINDEWVIKHIEKYPDNEVKIYNQWEQKIYTKRGYDNTFRGDGLTEGTYFYRIKYDGGKERRGYLMIVR